MWYLRQGAWVLAPVSHVPYLFQIFEPQGRNSRGSQVELVIPAEAWAVAHKGKRGIHDY